LRLFSLQLKMPVTISLFPFTALALIPPETILVFFYSFYTEGHTLTQVREANKISMGATRLRRRASSPFFSEDIFIPSGLSPHS